MTDVHCPQFLLIPRLLNPRQSGLSPSSHRNSPQVPPSEMPSTVLSSHPTWPSGGTGATGPSSSETPPLLAPGLARHALSCRSCRLPGALSVSLFVPPHFLSLCSRLHPGLSPCLCFLAPTDAICILKTLPAPHTSSPDCGLGLMAHLRSPLGYPGSTTNERSQRAPLTGPPGVLPQTCHLRNDVSVFPGALAKTWSHLGISFFLKILTEFVFGSSRLFL